MRSTADLFAQAQRHIPSGVNSPVRAFKDCGIYKFVHTRWEQNVTNIISYWNRLIVYISVIYTNSWESTTNLRNVLGSIGTKGTREKIGKSIVFRIPNAKKSSSMLPWWPGKTPNILGMRVGISRSGIRMSGDPFLLPSP